MKSGYDYNEMGLKRLFVDMIIQAMRDYERCKKRGQIVDGRPAFGVGVYRRASSSSSVKNLCDFFWAGWMEKIIELAGLQVDPHDIYEKLEPELWPNLTPQRPME